LKFRWAQVEFWADTGCASAPSLQGQAAMSSPFHNSSAAEVDRPVSSTGGAVSVELMRLLMDMAVALHRYGAPAHRLEKMVEDVALAFGTLAAALSTPTSITVAYGDIENQQLRLVRIRPGAVDLARLADLYALATRLKAREIEIASALAELHAIENDESRTLSWPARIACFALSSGSIAVFFAGGVEEMMAAAVVGVLVGILSSISYTTRRWQNVLEMLSAIIATVVVHVWAVLIEPVSVVETVLSSLIGLLPGFTLTIAMTELATGNLVSGSARSAAAAVTFMQLAMGVAIGTAISVAIGFPAVALVRTPPIFWLFPLSIAVASGSIAMLYRVDFRRLPLVVAAGGVAFAGTRLGALFIGPLLGGFVGALLLGVLGNMYGRRFMQPSMLIVAPGLTMLVPGSFGFRSMSALMQNDVVTGMSTLFSMLIIAASLVAGLLSANVISRPPASE
jgi:uncharacterized membrane protein YjjP (DUF1212 family)